MVVIGDGDLDEECVNVDNEYVLLKFENFGKWLFPFENIKGIAVMFSVITFICITELVKFR